jgi:hypothetical protein
VLSGDGWRTAHDTIKNAICSVLADFHVDFTCEVFSIFASCIPAGERREMLNGVTQQTRNGLVPDFRIGDISDDFNGDGAPVAGTQRLAELKRINFSETRYPLSVHRDGGRQIAVNKRAKALQREYEDKVTKVDNRYGTTPAGQNGPCCDRLMTYGSIIGLVVGHFGEWSSDLNKLVHAAARVAVPRVGHLYSTLGAERAKSVLMSKARREIAWAGLNANARLLLDRAEWVGPTYAAAAKNKEWRVQAKRKCASVREAYDAHVALQAVRQGYVMRDRAYNSDLNMV